MNTFRRLELQAKGWSDAELRKAEQILERAEKQDIFLSRLAFWSAVAVVIISNIIVSLVLVPFLVFFQPWALYLILILLAILVGWVYNFLITDVRHLERKHHILGGIIVPLIALGNMALIVIMAQKFLEKGAINSTNVNPWVMGIVFGVVFIIPSIVARIKIAVKNRRRAVLVR
ncbi:hypothetical protein HZC30_02815 [Candidatus Woesearchaeota archaeon]|nr:hypothetical protein [Candidatus Woesearchaeota archaeon]